MKEKRNLNGLTAVLSFTLLAFIQGSIHAQPDFQTEEINQSASIYIGPGLGLNDFGLGACLEVPIVEMLSAYGNIGLGGWGWKYGIGISIYPSKIPFKSAISLGYASASGLLDFTTELPVEPDDRMEEVTLDLYRVGTVNLIYSYNFHLGRKSKFSISAGYAISVTDDAYELKTTGLTLSDMSEQVLDIVQPGGLILGFKFLFGIE